MNQIIKERFPGKSVWPGSSPYAICLTHDVDLVCKHLYHYFLSVLKGGWVDIFRQLVTLSGIFAGSSSYWNFKRIMKVEDYFGVRSTFLFLAHAFGTFGWTKPWGTYSIRHPRIRKVLRELEEGGWEIGLHGSFSSYRDAGLMSREKAELEMILDNPVRCIRQHNLNYIPGQTLSIQAQAGLEADSTIGYAERYRMGKPEGGDRKIFPYYPDDSGIIELPMTLLDSMGFSREMVRKNVRHLLGEISSAGGLIVLNWHQSTFNSIEHPGRVAFYKEIIEEARVSGAWIATMGEIADRWKENKSR